MRSTIFKLSGAAVLFITAPFLFSEAAPPPQASQALKSPVSLRELSGSLEGLAERVRPAVVQIFSTSYATPDDTETTGASSLLSKQRATGSGVILTEDGYILTNNHVVHNALKIEVKLHSRAGGTVHGQESTVVAKLVGVDREADLAVIKIDRTGLPTLALGDSDSLKQGQLVMAFGNPLGLEGSMTMGIVSSTARTLKLDDPMAYVQTDAPINPGNSGGPLVDSEGRVVGINTFILTQSGGSEGIGFAVPSNVAKSSFEQIKKDGHVHRGQIGVVVQTITPMLAKGLGLSQDWGVLLADVVPDGPASKEGLKPGDVLLTLNGRTMEDSRQVDSMISRQALSAIVDISVDRDGKQLKFSVPITEREDDPQRFADMVTPDKNLIRRLGILVIEVNSKITDLLPDLRHDYGIVVAARSVDSPGSVLEAGDVIYEVNKTPVVSIAALRAALDQKKSGDTIVLQIQRGDTLKYVALELE